MSQSNWREHASLGVGIVIAVLLAFLYALLVAGAKYPCIEYATSETKKAHAKQERPDGSGATEPAKENTAQPGVYEVDCQKPKDHNAADLCEQRRMAKAAEEAGCIARVQLWLSGFGIVLVIGSLWLTGWAAVAASRAVQVAVASDLPRLRVSKLVFSRAGNAEPRDNSKYAQVTIGFANYGGKAARVTQYCFDMECVVKLPDVPVYKNVRNVFSNQIVVAPDGDFIFPPYPYLDSGNLQLAEVLAHKKRFFVYGYIAYLDHLDREHRTGFAAWWNHYGTGHDSFPDEATQRGETFNLVRKHRYTYET